MPDPPSRTVILIHGRSTKPPREPLFALWLEALRFGLERDHPDTLQRFDDTAVDFIYFGDISNEFLARHGDHSRYDGEHDLNARRRTLDDLKQHPRADHLDRAAYRRLPGRSGLLEGVADIFAGPLGVIGLAGPLIEAVAPDMREYWNEDTAFGAAVREPMIQPLGSALARSDRVCIIAHSLGSLITYDTLWKFTHASEYRSNFGPEMTVDLLITLGSPLGDSTVRRKVRGAGARGTRKYPHNIRRWVNLAAEDDYICHDERLADDYMAMVNHGLMPDPVEDHRIYNLSVRHGKSNPHHALGYLLHPVMADTIASWLADEQT